MVKKPLLVFPRATSGSRSNKNPGRNNLHLPSKETQAERLENKISELDRVLLNKTAYLGQNPTNLVAEMILVLEIAGQLDNFFKAVLKTPGMEFLAEYQSEFDADEIFFNLKNEERVESTIGGRLFLTMANQQALKELVGYWQEYKKPQHQQKFRRGVTKFRDLFTQLKDIRPYSVADRLRDTGVKDYIDEMRRASIDQLRFEIELAFKKDADSNELAYQEVSQLLRNNNGDIVRGSRTIIPEIHYHAFIAQAPISSFDDLSENTNISFLKSQQILFFRPVGQSILKHSDKEILEEHEAPEQLPEIEVEGEPIVALLDGLPLENHSLLAGRLKVDDPDGFGLNYLAEKRIHGTAMASLILNGDLNKLNQIPVKRPIYVRPVMKPEANSFSGGEFLPDDKLPLDLIHRAVVRMFDGEDETPPTAPHVKIINFSIGDAFRPFHNNLSTWAKLIDWLSYKYNVLFIISAGNKPENIHLDMSESEFDSAAPEAIQKAALQKIIEENFDRKLLTPAESVNSLTVGSSHNDYSTPGNFPQRKDLLSCTHLLSPISRIGFGFNKSVKPEILMPGGKKLFRKAPIQPDKNKTLLRIEDQILSFPPGNLVALPGPEGNLNYTGYLCGTSNSTALTSNLSIHLYEMLRGLNTELPINSRINEKYFTVILKSILTHSANWGEAQEILKNIIQDLPSVARNTGNKNLFPYLGYGCIDSEKILYCTDHKVTLIGFGELTKENEKNAHLYSFPLPPSMGQKRIEKKLVITLAWLSPLNFNTNKYRKAHLFFDNLTHNNHLTLSRSMYDYDAAQKGTLQHDILTGDRADAFIDGSTINIKINCREFASGLEKTEKIKYGLCVTLEIKENNEVAIYEEVKQRIQQRIRPRPA